jgi:response regulator of citrate/malate metabolism
MECKKYNVCVIDDKYELRKTLTKNLQDSKEFKFIGEAENLENGMALIEEQYPDAIFLDVKLKGCDAIKLLSFIKRRMNYLPAIILNAEFKDYKFAKEVSKQFRNEVVMILLKPLWKDWCKKESEIVHRIGDYYSNKTESLQSLKNLPVWN